MKRSTSNARTFGMWWDHFDATRSDHRMTREVSGGAFVSHLVSLSLLLPLHIAASSLQSETTLSTSNALNHVPYTVVARDQLCWFVFVSTRVNTW